MHESYEDIVRIWFLRLRPLFLNLLRKQYPALSLADAEDLYQEAFLAVRKNLLEGRVRDNTVWNGYILRIGLNMASKRMRHTGKTESLEDFGASSPAPLQIPTEEKSLGHEQAELLNKELATTPEPCKSIVRLFYYEDKSMKEISEAIGYKNADTAKVRKNQCMKSLMERIKESFRKAGV